MSFRCTAVWGFHRHSLQIIIFPHFKLVFDHFWHVFFFKWLFNSRKNKGFFDKLKCCSAKWRSLQSGRLYQNVWFGIYRKTLVNWLCFCSVDDSVDDFYSKKNVLFSYRTVPPPNHWSTIVGVLVPLP